MKRRKDEAVLNDNYKQAKSRNRCPYCKGEKVGVVDKRTVRTPGDDFRMDYSRRRRICHSCNTRWSTFEIHSSIWRIVREIIDTAEKKR